jgi:redox-sensitive bicupin YhaK (pirin superfamily)
MPEDRFVVISSRPTDLGGFSVRRLLPTRACRMVGPWIFFDHMGPATFLPGEGINVRPHPHINLATVTYLFEGEIWHRDSLGSSLAIAPGALNLMIAGKGIVHSERTREALRQSGQKLHGVQLWMALPQEFEEIEPSFHHYQKDEIPERHVDGVPVRLLMGEAFGLRSPVKIFSETLYLEARMTKGQRLSLPQVPELAVYLASGQAKVNGTALAEYDMAVCHSGEALDVEAMSDCFVAVVGGAPLGERFIDWNFVSSRQERIEQAKVLWRSKGFDAIPGDDDEFIPLPD